MRPFHQSIASLLVFGGALTGNISPVGPQAPGGARPRVITIEAHDYALALPAQVPEGVVTFRLVNHGKESHHAQIVRLERGRIMGDFVQAFTETAPMPDWVHYVGGPVGTAPGKERLATVRLTPGRYIVVCRVASPDRVPHVIKGMVREFEVVARPRAASDTFPTASDTITLNDYGFAQRRRLTSGHHSVLVVNAGPQPHEVVMLALAPGKTPTDFARWGLAGRYGPAPGAPVGGTQNLDAGAEATFDVDLAAGEYGFICFMPDANDGKRHFVHGMVTQFTVR